MVDAPLTVAFRTFGCKVNRVESDRAAASLLGRGVRLVAEEQAAVIVVNTCTVTAEADRKARKAVRHALALPHEPVVVVTGCLAALGGGGLSALGNRVVVEADRERVAERVGALLAADDAGILPSAAVRTGEGFRTRAVVKVQDGCDAYCAYCIVPYARGLPRSVPVAEVVAEVGNLVEAGATEVVLTGINIGRYAGSGQAADLATLVDAVAATGVRRIRISSIEPLDLTERLLDTLASTPALCAHLHVPLQSGADEVLRSMGRGYTLAEYTERIESARAAIPALAVTTDILAGFPGETAEHARVTLSAVEKLGFARLHVFRYSRRVGTAAATMEDPVPTQVVAERAAELRSLDVRLRERYAASRVGGRAELLVEKVEGDGRVTGTTRDYLTVRLADRARAFAPGDVVEIRLVRREGAHLSAVVC